MKNFIERVFVLWRWRQLMKLGGSLDGIVRFATEHKRLVMAHSPSEVSALGRIVALAHGRPRREVRSDYQRVLMDSLALEATVKKNVNVLQHIMGYCKKFLSSDEKAELMEVIGQHHQGLVPLIVPIVLFRIRRS